MKSTRGRSALTAVLAALSVLLVWSIAFGGGHANASIGKAQPDGNSAASHTNGHGNDDSRHSDGTAGTVGDPTQPQPTSSADANSGGANGQCPGGPYCSTRDGSASGNGNGNGAAVGKPCAGCVGKADNKNPKGQLPDASDGNNGYECDGNHGIARTNPAHTGCKAATSPSPSPTPSVTPSNSPSPSPSPSVSPTVKPTHSAKPPTPCVSTTATPCVLGETFTKLPTKVLASESTKLPFTGLPLTTVLMVALVVLILGAALSAIPARRRVRHR